MTGNPGLLPSPAFLPGVSRLVTLALEEDIGPGDITTDAIIDPQAKGKALIRAKEPLVLAGLDVARGVFLRLDPEVCFSAHRPDGCHLAAGEEIAVVEGRYRALLTGERTALNFLQRLSGVATHVRAFISQMPVSGPRITDTRKTLPGWRVLEKYAVRVGGASNHRMGLYDGVLIKDNHIAASGGITEAVRRAKKAAPHTLAIEVEAANLDQFQEALEAGADIIMCDNMDDESIQKAIHLSRGKALLEVSGGVTRSRLEKLASMGVDIVSVGALTHAARAVDISMDVYG